MDRAQDRRRRSRWANARSGSAVCCGRESFSRPHIRSAQRQWSWASGGGLRCSISHRHAGSINGRADPVFLLKELSQGMRQRRSEFLEGKQLAPKPEVDRTNCRKHLVPAIDQVGSSGVSQKTEVGIVCLRGKHVAQQLIAVILPPRPRQFTQPEYLAEVRAALHSGKGAAFEGTFGELGLDQQVAELHVHFSAIKLAFDKRHARPPSEDRHRSFLQSNQSSKL